MKTCFKCSEHKPLSDFYKHSKMADGHLNKCKECTKADVKRRHREDPEKIRAYDRERAKQPHRIALNTANMARYRRENPKRYAANTAVGNAVRDGRLSKLPCFVCGSADVEAHHADYDAPLSVVWLCPVHHKEIHLLDADFA